MCIICLGQPYNSSLKRKNDERTEDLFIVEADLPPGVRTRSSYDTTND
jgi:hypothetical protein